MKSRQNALKLIIVLENMFLILMLAKNYEIENGLKKRMLEAQNITNTNAIKYKDLYDNYDDYINTISKELQEANLTHNPLEVFANYLILEKNGYISFGNCFTYGNPDFEVIGNLGISIVDGKGVCRNEADNLYHILSSLGFETGRVIGVPNNYSVANHECVFTKLDDKIVIFDPTNKDVYLSNGSGKYLSIINGYSFESNEPSDFIEGFDVDNGDFYKYNHDDSNYAKDILDQFEIYLQEANNNKIYFEQYESDYLTPYEKYNHDVIQNYQK